MLKTIQKKKQKGTDGTLGQMVKTKLYRQNHTKKHTHSQKEKKEIYIYISIFKKKEESNQIYKHIYQ